MKIVQLVKGTNAIWNGDFQKAKVLVKPLVLVFGCRKVFERADVYQEIKEFFTTPEIVFGTSAGEIIEDNITESSIAVTAIEFEKSTYIIKRKNILDFEKNSYKTGLALMEDLSLENLKHVLLISEGSFVNGTELIKGVEFANKNTCAISGGLCGDGVGFTKTLASYNAIPSEGEVVAVGLYGDEIEVGYASYGGWAPFGPERTVTKSKDNVLYEIDGLPALELYKKYLGAKASELPAASLMFPLKIKAQGKDLIRTVLSIDETENKMILAGDITQGESVQLMMGSSDRLILAANQAVKIAKRAMVKEPDIAVLISCVGRKLVLGERAVEEVEAVGDAFEKTVPVTGFYSYGEMSPFYEDGNCELHNQTMTVTLLAE